MNYVGIKKVRLSPAEIYQNVNMAKQGNDEAFTKLLGHMNLFLLHMTKKYFIQGADKEDVYQEGAIKLINIIKTYDESKGKFIPFARESIERHLINKLREQMSKKRSILNKCYNLDSGVFLRHNIREKDLPIKIVQRDYEIFFAKELRRRLTTLEYGALALKKIGKFTYEEIADILVVNLKGVDNAINRATTKVREFLKNKEFRKKAGLIDENINYPFMYSCPRSYKYPEDYSDYDSDSFGSWGHAVRVFEDRMQE